MAPQDPKTEHPNRGRDDEAHAPDRPAPGEDDRGLGPRDEPEAPETPEPETPTP